MPFEEEDQKIAGKCFDVAIPKQIWFYGGLIWGNES